jgi:hypothetical protein
VPHEFEAPPIGNFYVTEANDTPTTKRHLSFTPAATTQAGGAGAGVGNEGGQAGGTDRPDSIEIPNPEYITSRLIGAWLLSIAPDWDMTASLRA